MTNVIPLGSGSLPQEFHPTATQAKIVVSEARIKFYRGKKMLSELTAAIDGLITEQTMFVAWWDANVGVRSGNPGNAALRSLLSVTAAETMTGITQQTVSRWRKSLQKPDKYRRLLLRDLALIAEANHRAEGSGETQWFTPAQYVEAARAVLGAIDLDPASHPTAQEWIGATQYFTEADDGLKQQWHGRVWCNPPYARDLIDRFAEKMIVELEHGHVSAAVMLTHSYTDTTWFHALAAVADAICFAHGRIKFIDDDGEPCNPTQGQAFFYFGGEIDRFAEQFSPLGLVMVRTS